MGVRRKSSSRWSISVRGSGPSSSMRATKSSRHRSHTLCRPARLRSSVDSQSTREHEQSGPHVDIFSLGFQIFIFQNFLIAAAGARD